jgi:hypothetical protein
LQNDRWIAHPEHGTMKKKRKEPDLFDQAAIELVKLQKHAIAAEKKLLIIVEGRDGAGKDGQPKIGFAIRETPDFDVADLIFEPCGELCRQLIIPRHRDQQRSCHASSILRMPGLAAA